MFPGPQCPEGPLPNGVKSGANAWSVWAVYQEACLVHSLVVEALVAVEAVAVAVDVQAQAPALDQNH